MLFMVDDEIIYKELHHLVTLSLISHSYSSCHVSLSFSLTYLLSSLFFPRLHCLVTFFDLSLYSCCHVSRFLSLPLIFFYLFFFSSRLCPLFSLYSSHSFPDAKSLTLPFCTTPSPLFFQLFSHLLSFYHASRPPFSLLITPVLFFLLSVTPTPPFFSITPSLNFFLITSFPCFYRLPIYSFYIYLSISLYLSLRLCLSVYVLSSLLFLFNSCPSLILLSKLPSNVMRQRIIG